MRGVDREQFGLRWAPGRADRGRVLRDPQVSQDGPDDAGVGEEGEDAHFTVEGRAPEGVHLVDSGKQLGPGTSGAAVGHVVADGAGGVARRLHSWWPYQNVMRSPRYFTPPIIRFTQGEATSATIPTPPMIMATVWKRAKGASVSSCPATRPAKRLPSAAPTNQIPII